MQLLDAEDRSEWLERLRALIARHGFARFVGAPILAPTDRFFPDAYTPDLSGVRTVARRLLGYAGLTELRVEVYGRNAPDEDALASTVLVTSRVETTEVELRVYALGRAEEVPLVLAHEVARVYRLLVDRARSQARHPYRAAILEDEEAEPDARQEEDASLTAFYLGFGLLATIGAHQYRATGEVRGGFRTVTRWVHRTIGALPSETACYLLAVQAAVRRLDEHEKASLLAHLAPDERAIFERYLRELDGETLCEALALPPRSEWPPCTHEVAPLLDDGWEPKIDADEPALPNRGRPVFRRRRTHAWHFLLGTAIAGAGAMAAAMLGGEGLAFPTGIAVVVACVLAALYGNRFRASDVCSDPMCEAKIPPQAETCPRCGGTVRGEIEGETPHALAVERLTEVTAFGEIVDREQEDGDPRYIETKIACPHCGWIPDGGAHWECECSPGDLFDTFATRAHCPRCDRRFPDTACIRCGHFSPYEFWCPVTESTDTESP